MRIRSCRLLPYRLPLKRPWRTQRGVLSERSGWILELTTEDGRQGYGDCAPLPAAGTESAEKAHAWLSRYLPTLPGRRLADVIVSLPLPTQTPAARHALESALLDLLSQLAGVPLRRRLSPDAVDCLPVNGSAGTLDEQALDRCLELTEQGFRILKLKVGLTTVDQEIRQLQQLCRRLPGRISLRLDANGAWSPSEAQRFLDEIAGLAIESLEEPLAEPTHAGLLRLQNATRIALALDESLARFPRARLLKEPPVARLILKPTVLGGILPALNLAVQAAKAGLQTLVTSTLESALGLQAAAQLAAALPRSTAPLAQGLATGSWFECDLAEVPGVVQGQMGLPDRPGLGIRLKPEFVDKE